MSEREQNIAKLMAIGKAQSPDKVNLLERALAQFTDVEVQALYAGLPDDMKRMGEP
jgi:hypothetical protein